MAAFIGRAAVKELGWQAKEVRARRNGGVSPRPFALYPSLLALPSCLDSEIHFINCGFDQLDRFGAMTTLIRIRFVQIAFGIIQSIPRRLHVRLIGSHRMIMPP